MTRPDAVLDELQDCISPWRYVICLMAKCNLGGRPAPRIIICSCYLHIHIFKSIMLWKQKFRDSQFLVNGKDTYEFFVEADENRESISSITEATAVEWLFGLSGFKDFFCEEFFESPKLIKPYFGLKEPFVRRNEKPGDIDLLLVHPEMPQKAIVFECKRIKIQTLEDENTKVNGLRNIEQGINQVSKYLNIGFHQVYLMIIFLDDSRNVKSNNVMLRQSDAYNFNWPKPIHPEIGLVLIKVTQQTKKHYRLMCGFGINIPKLATKRDQNSELTNKVFKLLTDSR